MDREEKVPLIPPDGATVDEAGERWMFLRRYYGSTWVLSGSDATFATEREGRFLTALWRERRKRRLAQLALWEPKEVEGNG